jgi:hydroxyacylglutathione hydrolase
MNETTVQVIGLPAFDDNYIWVLRRDGIAAVVDPGDAAPVQAHLTATGDRLAAILLTHHHGDHVGGVTGLVKGSASTIEVYGPAAENIAGVTRPLAGGECLRLPGLDLELDVLAVPGHTRGHLAYHAAAIGTSGALFCGDTLFGAGCGRLFEGTPTQMQASLARIAVLPAPTLVYCAHEYTQSNLRFAITVEPHNADIQARVADVAARRTARQATVPSTIGLECATNPFLRWDSPAVVAAAADRLRRLTRRPPSRPSPPSASGATVSAEFPPSPEQTP